MLPNSLIEYLVGIKKEPEEELDDTRYMFFVEHLKSYDHRHMFYILQDLKEDACSIPNNEDRVYIGNPVENTNGDRLSVTLDIPTYRAAKAGELMLHYSDDIIQVFYEYNFVEAISLLENQAFDEWWVIAGLLLARKEEVTEYEY